MADFAADWPGDRSADTLSRGLLYHCYYINKVGPHDKCGLTGIVKSNNQNNRTILPVCAGDRLVLRAVGADGARRGGLRADGRLIGGKNGKIYGMGMNEARRRLRRLGGAMGVWACSASSHRIA